MGSYVGTFGQAEYSTFTRENECEETFAMAIDLASCS